MPSVNDGAHADKRLALGLYESGARFRADPGNGSSWNEFGARKDLAHLGYSKTLVGAQIRYAVHDRNGWAVAMLGFSTGAWKLAPRDRLHRMRPRHKGRERSLPSRIDNPNFLILPGWIEIRARLPARTPAP